MVKLLFVTRRGFASKLIRWFTWSQFSHVEMIHPDNEKLCVGSSEGEGVRVAKVCDVVRGAKRVVVCEVPNVAAHKALEAAFHQLGKGYDWGAIFGFVFRRNWHSRKRWFCSEFVAYALEAGGVTVVRKHKNRITPADLLESPLVSLPSAYVCTGGCRDGEDC